MKFIRKCPCVMSMRTNVMRWVNPIVEHRDAPIALATPDEWCKKDCPQCKGTGVIWEEATGQIDVEAMKRDFDKKIARPWP